MSEITVVRNDTKFVLDFTIYDLDNNLVNLTGVSTIKLKFKSYTDGTVTSISGTVVGDPTLGRVQFIVGNEFTNITGDFKGEIEITYNSGGILTAPNISIKVIPDL